MLVTAIAIVLIVGFVLYISRNADVEGARQAKYEAARKTGAVMIEDFVDWTDPANLERDQ